MAQRSMMKPLTLLLLTLFVGILLGAAMTGSIMQKRLANVQLLTNGTGFSAQMVKVIEPLEDGQLENIEPILIQTGQDVEALIAGTRVELFLTLENMDKSLAPYLTENQLAKLQDRRQKAQDRYLGHRTRNR